ncbi:hypothetical protein H206_01729 [Candidatus Electrothrix aarhusensis]|uniref:Uncharacterized protein n=1 Tax=Candidatus Electrothrix aarhusensis TaxID=1859131 RepID=A0A3S3QET1_9BACT|nr:hypothetical protein H206_01729 [Candidatus Electrothrix aarhusensis]
MISGQIEEEPGRAQEDCLMLTFSEAVPNRP